MKEVAQKVMKEYSKMKRKNPDAYMKNKHYTFNQALKNTGYTDFSKPGNNPASAMGTIRHGPEAKLKKEFDTSARLTMPT